MLLLPFAKKMQVAYMDEYDDRCYIPMIARIADTVEVVGVRFLRDSESTALSRSAVVNLFGSRRCMRRKICFTDCTRQRCKGDWVEGKGKRHPTVSRVLRGAWALVDVAYNTFSRIN